MASGTRLTALDASFLGVESPTAHMHVGWAATFRAQEGDEAPAFEHFVHAAASVSFSLGLEDSHRINVRGRSASSNSHYRRRRAAA